MSIRKIIIFGFVLIKIFVLASCTSGEDEKIDKYLIFCGDAKKELADNEYSKIKYGISDIFNDRDYWSAKLNGKEVFIPKKSYNRVFLRKNNGAGTIFLSDGEGVSPHYRYSIGFPSKYFESTYKKLKQGLETTTEDISCNAETITDDLLYIEAIKVKNGLLNNLGEDFIGDRRYFRKIATKRNGDEIVLVAYHKDNLVSYKQYINTIDGGYSLNYTVIKKDLSNGSDVPDLQNTTPPWVTNLFVAISGNQQNLWTSFFLLRGRIRI